MEFLIFLIPFLIFLYMLYKHSKDDHVLLRRGIKTEEIFDIAFVSVIIGWLMSKAVPGDNSYVLAFYLMSSSIVIYAFCRRKKALLGRLFDIFSVSFLTAVPLWFILTGLFAKFEDIIGLVVLSVVLLTVDVIFLKYLYPKILNRTLPDGLLSSFLISTYSFIYICYRLVSGFIYKYGLINIETVSHIVFLAVGIFLFFKSRK